MLPNEVHHGGEDEGLVAGEESQQAHQNEVDESDPGLGQLEQREGRDGDEAVLDLEVPRDYLDGIALDLRGCGSLRGGRTRTGGGVHSTGVVELGSSPQTRVVVLDDLAVDDPHHDLLRQK